MNEESGMKTVGFRFGAYVDGSTNIGPVKDLPHVPKRMEQVVDVSYFGLQKYHMQHFLKVHSLGISKFYSSI